jgi:TolA-binding protein
MASENKAAEAQTKYAEAAGKFMIPAQFFDDEEITPQALSNAAKALQKAGQPDKADEFLKQLKSKYPNYSNP